MLKKNCEYIVEVVDIGSEGFSIAKIENIVVFINSGVVGDILKIVIIKIKKFYAIGKIIEILKKSNLRTDPLCSVFEKCGGCCLQNILYEHQLVIKKNKVAQNLKKIANLDNIKVLDVIGMQHPYRYRNKTQFPVRYDGNNINIGFFKYNTHIVVDVYDCVVSHEINFEIINILKKFMQEHEITAYDELGHTGCVRHIVTKVAFTTKEVMICLVLNEHNKILEEKLPTLFENIKGLASVLINFNMKKTNVVLGEKTKIAYGKHYIYDILNNIRFRISIHSFFQINPAQTQILYKKAIECAQLCGNELVYDLYCGIGTISLILANYVSKVIGVEVINQAIIDANYNKEINNIQNVEFICGLCEEIIKKIYYDRRLQPDVVFLDPPRKGCNIELINTILEIKPKKIIYISCDTATLARDIKNLSTIYDIEFVLPVDCFCHTIKIETISKLVLK